MRRHDLTPLDARRFRTGRASLDLVHTGGEGELAVWELLHTPADLERWLAVVVDADLETASAGDLAATKQLRAAALGVARALVAGEPLRPDDLRLVNSAAQSPPLVPRLVAGRIELQRGTVEQACSTLARDLQDLIAGPLSARVRVCAAEDCELFFVDASRPGRRRWCSMERCGNRAKARAYSARQTGG